MVALHSLLCHSYFRRKANGCGAWNNEDISSANSDTGFWHEAQLTCIQIRRTPKMQGTSSDRPRIAVVRLERARSALDSPPYLVHLARYQASHLLQDRRQMLRGPLRAHPRQCSTLCRLHRGASPGSTWATPSSSRHGSQLYPTWSNSPVMLINLDLGVLMRHAYFSLQY